MSVVASCCGFGDLFSNILPINMSPEMVKRDSCCFVQIVTQWSCNEKLEPCCIRNVHSSDKKENKWPLILVGNG